MKLRILKLTPEQFAGLLGGKQVAFSSKLPSDLEVLDIKVDLFNRQVSVVVRSDSFEDAAESSPIPEILSTNTVHPVAASHASSVSVEAKPLQPAPKPAAPTPSQVTQKTVVSAAKTEPKPEVTVSAAIAKSLVPPSNRYAAKMENEFSPEQQKLLSFTVKADCVVVKPVMFLKAEWDDINETVRSLGGKWVKGDIISYWEIPLS
jgi:hypothetical protein